MMDSATADHFNELRRRLLMCVAVWLVAFLGFYIIKELLFEWLIAPLKMALGEENKLVFLAVHELFFTYVKMSFLGGLFVVLPLLLWELWRFVAPGLYDSERKIIWPFLVATPLLFYAGGAFTYFIIMPIVAAFFLGFQTADIAALRAVGAYLSFFTKMVFAFGLAFELPVALLVAIKFGVVTVDQLRHFRRYAVVLIIIAAAVLTPPDPASQLLLAIPMMLLYEVAIWGARFFGEKQSPKAGTSE